MWFMRNTIRDLHVFGRQLVESLGRAGVDTKPVRVTEATPTGVALTIVEAGGQNQIVVASDANGRLAPEDVAAGLDAAEGFLLLQLETPRSRRSTRLSTTRRACAPTTRPPR